MCNFRRKPDDFPTSRRSENLIGCQAERHSADELTSVSDVMQLR
jgi:hypothetical protein